ncbi:hypothetical protein [Coleofasciculus sp. FACHB-T130]|nr:hypothetical protein [Coleofasciculus sp. FACHB-T130]
MSQLPQPETSEKYWVLYWYKKRQSLEKSMSQALKMSHFQGTWHLVAYLQEACYWVAQKTTANCSNGQNTVADCFQIAIAQDKVLNGLNPSQGRVTLSLGVVSRRFMSPRKPSPVANFLNQTALLGTRSLLTIAKETGNKLSSHPLVRSHPI